jgi:hypothetical protein
MMIELFFLIKDIVSYGEPIPTTTIPQNELVPVADTRFYALNAEIIHSYRVKVVLIQFEVYAYENGMVSLVGVDVPNCSNQCAKLVEISAGNPVGGTNFGTFNVVKGYNRINITEGRQLLTNEVILVTGPIAVDTGLEGHFSDVHNCLTCSGCSNYACTFSVYCGSCNKPMKLKRAYIRFTVRHYDDAFTDSDANLMTYFYRKIFEFKVSYPEVGDYTISYAGLTTQIKVTQNYSETINIKCQTKKIYLNQLLKCYGQVSSKRPGGINLKVNMGDQTEYTLTSNNKLRFGSDVPPVIKYKILSTQDFLPLNAEILFSYGIAKKLIFYATSSGTMKLNVRFFKFLFLFFKS